jgi:caffeoyl-CoA O-methyltransferase
MKPLVDEAIENYAAAKSAAESALFKELAWRTYAEAKWPQMQVGHLEGAFLRLLVRICRARRVLEIGTFTGYSALAMAEGLPADGELVTLDLDPENTRMAREFWDKSGQGKKIRLVLGPALETLATLTGPFDLVFIDADKENYKNYWEACLPKVRQGGLIVADNVLWSGRVLDPQDETDRAIAAFNEHVAQDGRVEAVMLPVRDGMTLAWKR